MGYEVSGILYSSPFAGSRWLCKKRVWSSERLNLRRTWKTGGSASSGLPGLGWGGAWLVLHGEKVKAFKSFP